MTTIKDALLKVDMLLGKALRSSDYLSPEAGRWQELIHHIFLLGERKASLVDKDKLHKLFHSQWTESVGGETYVKSEWLALEKDLVGLGLYEKKALTPEDDE